MKNGILPPHNEKRCRTMEELDKAKNVEEEEEEDEEEGEAKNVKL